MQAVDDRPLRDRAPRMAMGTCGFSCLARNPRTCGGRRPGRCHFRWRCAAGRPHGRSRVAGGVDRQLLGPTKEL